MCGSDASGTHWVLKVHVQFKEGGFQRQVREKHCLHFPAPFPPMNLRVGGIQGIGLPSSIKLGFRFEGTQFQVRKCRS